MPRNGSGTYSQPFPPVVEGTTIESTVYNGFTSDVAIDLNTPRPISSGGTGADNAADAMAALGGEGSKIEVLNYDSHNFTAGSFYSKASATNPPVALHAFAGICYVAVVSGIATSDMFIEVRDRDEATSPGSLYVRQKKNGAWGGWLKAVGTSMGATAPGSPSDGMFWWDPTRGKLFVWYSDPNTAQWVEAVAMPDMNPDDFIRIDIDQALTETEKAQGRENIDAASVVYVDTRDALKVAKAGDTMTGTLTGTMFNGTHLQLRDSGATVNKLFRCNGLASLEVLNSAQDTVILSLSDAGVFGTTNAISSGYGYKTKLGASGAMGTNWYNLHYAGPVSLWIDTSNMGNITVTSDYRIKKDVIDLPGMWDTVKALRPIRYTQADFTPPAQLEHIAGEKAAGREVSEGHMFKADDIERWGFIAHELQETLVPSAATGVKDSHDHVQSPEVMPVIAALTKALQEAMVRIEALEATRL